MTGFPLGKAKRCLFRMVAFLCQVLMWLGLFAGSLWAFGALWFDFPLDSQRAWVAVGFGITVILVGGFMRSHWWAKPGIAMAIVGVMLWWFTLQPRQYRDWVPELALLPYATQVGEEVTLHNVRHLDYRTEEDFTPHYERRLLDLRNLRGMDLFICYWGSRYMAHPILSFDFGCDGRICFSIETRRERGESYSALGGLFRQFELTCIVADERDVIRVRTNYRKGEEVYLYPLKAPFMRESFLEYLQTVNELHESPRWYHAITDNCTSAIRHQRAASARTPWDWRLLVNGFVDELLYERGSIDRSVQFEELKRRSLINARAMEANGASDFSERIREGFQTKALSSEGAAKKP